MTGHVVVFALCAAGFCGIALAVERQQEALFGQAFANGPTRGLRIAGGAGLVLGFLVAVRLQGWSLGSVAWVGHLSFAAGCVFAAMVALARRRSRH